MARVKASSRSNGRGSKEAVEKRRVARQLNALLSEGGSGPKQLAGRTEKRRQRLVRELKGKEGGKPIKPIEFVSKVNELLAIGETVASLKKQGVKPRKTTLNQDVSDVVIKAQKAYGFREDAWKMLGFSIADISESGQKVSKRPRKRASP